MYPTHAGAVRECLFLSRAEGGKLTGAAAATLTGISCLRASHMLTAEHLLHAGVFLLGPTIGEEPAGAAVRATCWSTAAGPAAAVCLQCCCLPNTQRWHTLQSMQAPAPSEISCASACTCTQFVAASSSIYIGRGPHQGLCRGCTMASWMFQLSSIQCNADLENIAVIGHCRLQALAKELGVVLPGEVSSQEGGREGGARSSCISKHQQQQRPQQHQQASNFPAAVFPVDRRR